MHQITVFCENLVLFKSTFFFPLAKKKFKGLKSGDQVFKWPAYNHSLFSVQFGTRFWEDFSWHKLTLSSLKGWGQVRKKPLSINQQFFVLLQSKDLHI